MKKMIPTLFAALFAALSVIGCSPTERATERPSAAYYPPSPPSVKVVLIAGEENAMGYKPSSSIFDEDSRTNVSAEKYSEYLRGYENVRLKYRNMLNSSAVREESKGFVNAGITESTFGPELGIAEVLHYSFPNETAYVLKYCGARPSSLHTQWSPKSKGYYDGMKKFFREGLKEIAEAESGSKIEVAAFCFVQGESDARYGVEGYSAVLEELSDAVRKEFENNAPENGIAFVDVGVNDNYVGFDRLNAVKREFAETDSRNYFIDVSAAGLSNETDNMDRRHYDSYSELRLGNILGGKIVETLDDGIDCKRAELSETREKTMSDGYSLVVYADGVAARSVWKFSNVDGAVRIRCEVTDPFVTNGDGVKVYLCRKTEGGFTDGDKSVFVTVGGEAVVSEYSDGAFAEKGSLSVQTFAITDGYGIEFSVEADFEVFLSFTLVNANESVVERTFTENGEISGKPYTFSRLDGTAIVKNSLVGGENLGNADCFAAQGFDYSDDHGDSPFVVVGENAQDNKTYFSDFYGNEFFAEGVFEVLSVENGEIYPKIGIRIVTKNDTGAFYYADLQEGIDALGYARISNGTFTDFSLTEKSAEYRDRIVRLGVYRKGDSAIVFVNGKKAFTVDKNAFNVGDSDVYVGFETFNVRVVVSDYYILSGEAAAEKLKEY